MKIKINISKRDYNIIGITLLAGLFLGWLFFHGSGSKTVTEQVTEEHIHEKATIWTCSMHPQIRMDKSGKCPICGMDLIPLVENDGSEEAVSPDEIQMSESAMKLADVQTMLVRSDYSNKVVYLLGKVKPDERNIAVLTARFGGRIEKLFVNFTGQYVAKGEKLATIYSPNLVTAQRELLEAVEYRQSNPSYYMAVRNKLKLWDLTEAQIDGIESMGEPQSYFEILSPISGTVTERHVALGDYIKEGSTLFQVIDLSRIWIIFDAYESDLPWLRNGDEVQFTVQSLPGKTFRGKITFITPFLNAKTRVASVRVEANNVGMQLKPEMFANGIIKPRISGSKKDLLIPKTSILWTGKRAIVYVKVPGRERPSFKYREITLGPEAGEFYVINEGLQEGEEIAVNGVFKIDAASQLAGKPSMMNPEGGKVSTTHDHGGMVMDSESPENHAEHTETNIKKGITETDTDYDRMDNEIKSSDINLKFKEQLTKVYRAYIPMKNAFVESNPHDVAQVAEKVSNALEEVDMKLLAGKSHIDWMNLMKLLKESLSIMEKDHDIKSQREAFANFNSAFYKSIKQFGLSDVITYYQYCPMAVDDNGAYWLSEIKEISNPYFGDEMLRCGETRETLKY